MTYEEILQEMRDVMKLNTEARRKSNDALTHAANVITKVATEDPKLLAKEYERGATDAWVLAAKIGCSPDVGGLGSSKLKDIYGDYNYTNIMMNYDYISAKQKMDEYKIKENLKKEAAECNSLVMGNIVECEGMVNEYEYGKFKGIFLGDSHPGEKENGAYCVLAKGCELPMMLSKDNWILRKTDNHVAILVINKQEECDCII